MKYLHTMVRARDLDETLDFYCNKLGLEEVRRYDSEAGRFTLVFLAAPGDRESAEAGNSPCVEITWNWDPEDYDGGRNFGHLAYQVEDIYALCQSLMDQGVTIIKRCESSAVCLWDCKGPVDREITVSVVGDVTNHLREVHRFDVHIGNILDTDA